MKPILHLFITLLLFCSTVFGQNYNFKRFSVEEGLPEPGLYCIEENGDGELWLGLESGGIAIFDGESFRPFRSEINIGKDIRTIFKSSTDEMWIGSSYEGISVFDHGFVRKFSIKEGLYSNHIRSFVEDFEGRIWAGTIGGGISVFDDAKLVETLNEKSGIISNNVKALVRRSNGNIWAGTSRGISIYNGFELKGNLTKKDGLVSNEILSLAEDDFGNVWIGTMEGLSVKVEDSIINIGVNEGLEQLRVKSILIDRHSNIWIGTRNGIGKIEIEDIKDRRFKITWFTQNNGLSNNRIRCMYEDQSGAIWIGTYFGGVNMLFNESFSLYTSNHGLTDDAVSFVEENHNDSSLWLGIYGAGLNILDKGVVNSISSKEGLSNNYINAIVHLDSRSSIVGTNEGVNLIRNKEVTEVWDSYKGHFKNNKITHLAGEDKLCFGLTAKHEAFGFTVDSVFIYDSLLTSSLSKQIKERINAIYYLKNSFWFVSDSIIYNAKVNDGSLVILNRWNVSGVESLGDWKDGVLGYTCSNLIFSITNNVSIIDSIVSEKKIRFLIKDNKAGFWFGIDQNIQHIELKKNKVISRKSYDYNEGFIGRQSFKNSAEVNENNELFIGTIKGLLRVESIVYKGINRDLKVFFNGLYNGNDKLEIRKYSKSVKAGIPIGLELPYNKNQLNFRAKVFHLKNTKEVAFKYELGGDDEITEFGSSDNIIFNLSSGDYELKVYAKTQWGEWSSVPMVIEFSITQPFWYNPTYIISLLLILVIVVLLFLNYRTKKLEKEKEKLEKIVFKRTEELIVEQEKSEELLLNILPKGIAQELKLKGKASTRKYKKASVLFTDFKGFTSLSSNMDPIELVACLDEIFGEFDLVIERNHLEKIKTIGDAYMCASGIPRENSKHAFNIVIAGLELIEVMRRFNSKRKLEGKKEWEVRVGIHSGELIAGVVGRKKFAYDIWGDTVNIASRMESNSEPGRLNISKATHDLIEGLFDMESRGEIEAKNRGMLEMFFVNKKLTK
jgi:class 3 adenylate cyclase/ligand-binding sensor domain-containing protein